jgi:hypothetical protein
MPSQPPIKWVPVLFSSGVMRRGPEADHSLQTSAEVKEMSLYTPTPSTSSWRSV